MLTLDMADQQLAEVRQTGDRLRGAVRALVDALPPGARNISGLSRYLLLHKATCQRLIEGLEHVHDSIESFARLPGLRGLTTFVEAAELRQVDPVCVAAVRSAIREYERMLATHGKTQSGLIKLIDSLRAAEPSESDTQFRASSASPVVVVRRTQRDRAQDRRKALFEAARSLTGEEVGVKAIVAVIQPGKINAGALNSAFAVVLQAARRHPFSRPIVPFILGGWWAKHADSAGLRPPGVAKEVPAHELIEAFSTTGLKPVRLEGADARTILVADLTSSARSPQDPRDPAALGPEDIAMLFRTSTAPNPTVDPEHRLSVAARITNPCRALVIDVLIHRSINVTLPDRADAYSLAAPPGDSPRGDPEHCWHERFPDSMQVSRIREGVHQPEPLYARQQQLIEHMIAREAIEQTDFVHLRAQTAYPMWQSEYRLDFRPNAPSQMVS